MKAVAWLAWIAASPYLAIAAEDARVSDALYRISREASGLWQTAPRFLAKEAITQKAAVTQRKRGKPATIVLLTREIVSYYSLAALKGAPEALREFRHTFAIDGSSIEDEKWALEEFRSELQSKDDPAKRALIDAFEKRCLSSAATDFGQLLLLFTRPNLQNYDFKLAGETRVGDDNAWRISFTQKAGKESLHLTELGAKRTDKLQGEITVRQGDYLPLRIDLNDSHMRAESEIRDEVKLAYMVVSGGLLPAALVYHRYVNNQLVLESAYRYFGWQPLANK